MRRERRVAAGEGHGRETYRIGRGRITLVTDQFLASTDFQVAHRYYCAVGCAQAVDDDCPGPGDLEVVADHGRSVVVTDIEFKVTAGGCAVEGVAAIVNAAVQDELTGIDRAERPG